MGSLDAALVDLGGLPVAAAVRGGGAHGAYQAALDNEWYKAIRALREAQAHRRANAALEGVAQAA